jgi:hypothetical protein
VNGLRGLSDHREPGSTGFHALDRLKRHAGLEFGVVSSAFAFHFVCVRFGLQSAPTHHNHSLATGPISGVRLRMPPVGRRMGPEMGQRH